MERVPAADLTKRRAEGLTPLVQCRAILESLASLRGMLLRQAKTLDFLRWEHFCLAMFRPACRLHAWVVSESSFIVIPWSCMGCAYMLSVCRCICCCDMPRGWTSHHAALTVNECPWPPQCSVLGKCSLYIVAAFVNVHNAGPQAWSTGMVIEPVELFIEAAPVHSGRQEVRQNADVREADGQTQKGRLLAYVFSALAHESACLEFPGFIVQS
eukprot:scaffold282284_cov18-Tisochrysis_lutea.AAC.2